MYEHIINQLNFYIQQKETSAQTFVGRMVGSALHEECNTLSAAVQAITTLSEFHDSVELNKLAAKGYFENAEEVIHRAVKEFRERLVSKFTIAACGDDTSTFSLEEISNIINGIYLELDQKKYFVTEEKNDA